MKCISPLVIFCSPLLLLPVTFSQCYGTWNIDTSSYKDFGECQRRDPGLLVWWVTDADDSFRIHVSKAPYPGNREKTWTYVHGSPLYDYNDELLISSYDDLNPGQKYYVTFVCYCLGDCTCKGDKWGKFEWYIVECKCPSGWYEIAPCSWEKNVQCEAPPPPYIFEYEVKDFEFDSPSAISTEKLSSNSNGIIKNCADGVTTDHEVNMSLRIGNSQSMTVSKSFTSSKTNEVAVGVSVTATAKAGVIFAETSVSATASFDYSHSWETSETEEDSTTMETSSEIEFTLAQTVSVEPNTCVEYSLSTHVSSEPLTVQYTAKTYLTIFHNDGTNKEPQVKGPQVTDFETLNAIREYLFSEYDSTIVPSSSTIVYPIEGEFSGLYVTEADTETSNCDECGTPSGPPAAAPSNPPSGPPAAAPSNPPIDAPDDAPISPQENAAGDPSSKAAVLGLNGIAVGVMLALPFALN